MLLRMGVIVARQCDGKAMHALAQLPFVLDAAFPVYWGEEGVVVGGILYRKQFAHT